MNTIHITTHDHIGDSVILTGAVWNVMQAHPGVRFRYSGSAEDVWRLVPGVETGADGTVPLKVTYGTEEEERRASNGNLVEGFTRELCRLAGIPMVPVATRVPCIPLTAEMRRRGEWAKGRILVNANFQTCAKSKAYPWWQEVVNLLDGYDVVQIGSAERRNVSRPLAHVIDMRGQTDDVIDYFSAVANAACIVTPPSSSMNISAAYGTPCVVVNGAREAAMLSDYRNCVYVSQPCCGHDGVFSGCVALSMNPDSERGCRFPRAVDDVICSKCMAEIHPMRIAAEVRRMMISQSSSPLAQAGAQTTMEV